MAGTLKQKVDNLLRDLFLTALLLGGGAAVYNYLYLPARDIRQNLDGELRTVLDRQAAKRKLLDATRAKCGELVQGDPETVSEVIRQELLKGRADEFFQ